MKTILYKSVIIVVSLALLDIGIGIIYKILLKKLPDSGLYQTDCYYSVNKAKPDVLILGASTAKHNYSTSLFEERGYTVYNAGLDGNEMLYYLAVLESVLDKGTPSIVLLDLNPSSLNGSWLRRAFEIKYLFNSNAHIKKMLLSNPADPYFKIKSLSNAFIYNSSLPWIIRAFLSSNKSHNGYTPLYGQNQEDLKEVNGGFEASEIEKKALIDFINLCKEHNISLYVFISPNYVIRTNNEFNLYVGKVLQDANVPFYDYSNDKLFMCHKDWYRDIYHLNNIGSEEYTKCVINIISEH